MIRNTAGQTWEVEARWLSGAPYTNGAATLTAKISKDGGAYTAVADTNPTELESGRYAFSLSQAETDFAVASLLPVCSVAGVIARAVPMAQMTTPAAWDWATTSDLSGLAQTGEAAAAVSGLALEDTSQDILTAVGAITGGSGGDYSQTVTVTNATTHAVIPNATVRILSGEILIDVQQANGSGVAIPSADAGTGYTLRVTATGFQKKDTVINVAGAASIPVELTPITIPVATDPGTVTGYLRLYDGTTPSPGSKLYVRQYSPTAQRGMDGTTQEWTADGNGDASGALWDAEWYQIRYGTTGDWSEPFEVAEDEANPGTMNLVGVLGTP